MSGPNRPLARSRGREASGRHRVAVSFLWGALVLALSSLPAVAAVKAWLDTNRVAPGSSVQLTLEYDGQTGAQPDLSPLERNFDVLGTSRATTVQILNGSTSAKTQVMVTLSPKHAGRLTVPSIAWNGQRSAPLALDVTPSAGHGASGAGPALARQVFLETRFSPARPYVQAAVEVTVRLYTREPLYDPHLALASTNDFVVRQVGSDRQGTVQRGSESYEVVTRHYVVFPLRSGQLTLPGPVLDARVAVRSSSAAASNPFAGFFGSSVFGNVFPTVKPIRLHGRAIRLDVRPRPAAAVGRYWMPASTVTLKSAWHPATLRAKAGNPVTLDLSVTATGLTAAQLPDLSHLIVLPPGLKAYPDSPKLADSAHDGTVVGTRRQSIALIADRPGRYTLPALRIKWWDTHSNQPRVATLPARTLAIAPAPGAAVPSHPASKGTSPALPASRPSAGSVTPPRAAHGSKKVGAAAARGFGARLTHNLPWIAVIAALALAWLGTLAAWLRLRRRVARQDQPPATPASSLASAPPTAAAARTAFRKACRANRPASARRHLLEWVGASWPGEAPRGLNALARALDDPELTTLLRELDRACYVGEAWRGEALEAALTTLPKPARVPSRRRAADLASLYP